MSLNFSFLNGFCIRNIANTIRFSRFIFQFQFIEMQPYAVKQISLAHQGLFATQPIEAGITIAKYEGTIINERDFPNRTDWSYCLTLDDDGNHIDGNLNGNEMRFLNHSCTPNCDVTDDCHIVTLRPIASGEELTIDYGEAIDGDPVTPCWCRSADCRGVILNLSNLPVQP
jgi:SET domain-containing protein